MQKNSVKIMENVILNFLVQKLGSLLRYYSKEMLTMTKILYQLTTQKIWFLYLQQKEEL